MPILRVNQADLHYTDQGTGPGNLFFGHGLLWSGEMFRAQVDYFSRRYRCVTLDWRGQGRSAITPDGYDMDTLAADAAAVIEQLGLAPCHYVGLSMGGFVGLRLALHRPELLRSLILLESTADPEPAANVPRYRRLNWVARWIGLWPVAGRVMPIMFGRNFLTDPARAAERRYWRQQLLRNRRHGITRAVAGVIERQGVYAHLDRISLPTLIVVGDQDVATPPTYSQRMQARIPGAQLIVIPGAGHSATVEEPAAINAAIDSFLQQVGTAG